MGRVHPLTYLCALASIAGFYFAAVSTSDFVAHLDRQVHGIHCSFLPGLAETDSSGASGCHTTLMSPYSSVFRDAIWGGVPVALPGMAVFSFLGFWCMWMAINGRDRERRATGFLFAGSLVPLFTSALMGYLSMVELDAACKLCIGIYAASGALSVFSLVLWRLAESERPSAKGNATTRSDERSASMQAPLSWGTLGLAFAAGLTCVGISVGAYAAATPDYSTYVGSCGSLPNVPRPADVLIPYGPQKGLPRMLEVIDPLCPSCKGFEERFSAMPASKKVDRELLLFPLDESCNWMIDRSIHPGACSISEAVLCSTDPHPVLAWAFENQKRIMEATEKDPKAAARMAKARFPGLAECIGSAEVGAKLNQSLRFAVKNQMQILTPQVFVEGVRLCGEDTDLGLDFALPRLVEMTKNQPRQKLIEAEPAQLADEAAPKNKKASKRKQPDEPKARADGPAKDVVAPDEPNDESGTESSAPLDEPSGGTPAEGSVPGTKPTPAPAPPAKKPPPASLPLATPTPPAAPAAEREAP